MESRNIYLFSWIIFICLVSGEAEMLRRDQFPPNFVFGASSSAYQYEGAANEDGKGQGIWDTFTHQGNVIDGSTGDISSDGYHRYKEDVQHLSETGFDAFRFSISWSRLIPDGRGAVNPKGLEFYNNLINELLDKGIQPYATLHHFDLPQKLEDEYGGWISPRIIEDFLAFSEICFREFGDRVKIWITINEPNALAELGYSEGIIAPKRCSIPEMHCTVGNSTTEPYLAVHYMLLAHSAVVKLYRDKFQKSQNGSIGICILAYWYWPLTNSTADILAWQRALDFHIGWALEPLLYEQYPKTMQEIVGPRLPVFTESQKKDLKNSFDFLGLNHYSTLYIYDRPNISEPTSYFDDMAVLAKRWQFYSAAEGVQSPAVKNLGFGSVPLGFQHLLLHMKARYGNPPVLVTECGYPEQNVPVLPLSKGVNDTLRVSFFRDYITHMHNAISKGSNVKGFFAWTLVDGFEYAMGYFMRLGLYYVDTDLERYPKKSARWFRRVLALKPSSSLASY